MEAAVTTTEDGGFRYHGGFDKGAIKSSIRDDLTAKRFIRGASTISMQVAKNLYLARDKNLSRKLQEAILTVYLEQELTKDQILELYFNVVELGPMIYGIGPAAEYYFNTTPSDLSLGQVVYLASLLPSPKKVFFGADGQVTKGWLGYLHKLMKIMRDRNKITDQDLADGLSEVITYKVAKSPRVPGIQEAPFDLNGDQTWTAPEGP
jgi:membrane peptidoglycan carboxypeptidase